MIKLELEIWWSALKMTSGRNVCMDQNLNKFCEYLRYISAKPGDYLIEPKFRITESGCEEYKRISVKEFRKV